MIVYIPDKIYQEMKIKGEEKDEFFKTVFQEWIDNVSAVGTLLDKEIEEIKVIIENNT